MDIFIGNLAPEIRESNIRDAFKDLGVVTRVTLLRDAARVSRGCGFVTMPNRAEAEAAIAALNGAEWCGRQMAVKQARKQRRRTELIDGSTI